MRWKQNEWLTRKLPKLDGRKNSTLRSVEGLHSTRQPFQHYRRRPSWHKDCPAKIKINFHTCYNTINMKKIGWTIPKKKIRPTGFDVSWILWEGRNLAKKWCLLFPVVNLCPILVLDRVFFYWIRSVSLIPRMELFSKIEWGAKRLFPLDNHARKSFWKGNWSTLWQPLNQPAP